MSSPLYIPPGLRNSQPTDERPHDTDWAAEHEIWLDWTAGHAGPHAASPEDLAEDAAKPLPRGTCDGCGRDRPLAAWGAIYIIAGRILCPDCAGQINDPTNPQPQEASS